jgi:hypothetical protein
MLAPLLDRLRVSFPYFVALGLPLAGIVLAMVKFSERDRDEGLRLLAATLLGCVFYALLLTR